MKILLQLKVSRKHLKVTRTDNVYMYKLKKKKPTPIYAYLDLYEMEPPSLIISCAIL